MADHYRRSLEYLDDVDTLASDLADAYRAGAARETVGDIHAQLSRSLKLADIHATLSVRQALQDSRLGLVSA